MPRHGSLHRRGLALGVLACFLAVPGPSGAQVFEAVGARALGMAGAFTAVADDATAVYWNPAGLATGGPASLVWDRIRGGTLDAELGSAEGASRRAATFVSLTTYPLGISHYRLAHREVRPGLPAEEVVPDREDREPSVWTVSSLVTHQTGVTILQSLAQGLVIGSTVKHVSGRAGRAGSRAGPGAGALLDAAEALETQVTRRFDLDVGLMAAMGRVRAGLVFRNLTEPAFSAPEGDALVLERQARAGLALMPLPRLTVAVDADLGRTRTAEGERRQLAVGAEHWPLERLGVRGGVRVNLLAEREPVVAIGLSTAILSGVWVDALLSYGAVPTDRSWGVAARLGY